MSQKQKKSVKIGSYVCIVLIAVAAAGMMVSTASGYGEYTPISSVTIDNPTDPNITTQSEDDFVCNQSTDYDVDGNDIVQDTVTMWWEVELGAFKWDDFIGQVVVYVAPSNAVNGVTLTVHGSDASEDIVMGWGVCPWVVDISDGLALEDEPSYDWGDPNFVHRSALYNDTDVSDSMELNIF